MKIFAFTRQGYENDAAQEFKNNAVMFHMPKKAEKGLSYFVGDCPNTTFTKLRNLDQRDLVFSREFVAVAPKLTDLPETDRISPIIEAIGQLLVENEQECLYKDLVVTFPDHEKFKPLAKFCTKFTPILESKLKKLGFKKVYTRQDMLSLYVIFISYSEAYVGFSLPLMRSPWVGGIARLQLPSTAPSRSILKLEEAWRYFLNGTERALYLKEGMTAVDLGAAPGGWTYALFKKGFYVQSIDHGELVPELSSSDYITHKKVDAFKFFVKSPVDWLVCDIVENPYQVTELICEWMRRDLFDYAVVNLKLPMKDAFMTVSECLERLKNANKKRFRDFSVKQLYHDRQEVTVMIIRDARD